MSFVFNVTLIIFLFYFILLFYQALQSRLKYLSTHTIKLQSADESSNEKHMESESGTGDQSDHEAVPPQTPLSSQLETEAILTLEPPPVASPREILQPLDITPFVR